MRTRYVCLAIALLASCGGDGDADGPQPDENGCCPMEIFSFVCNGNQPIGGRPGPDGCVLSNIDGAYIQTSDDGCSVWRDVTHDPSSHGASRRVCGPAPVDAGPVRFDAGPALLAAFECDCVETDEDPPASFPYPGGNTCFDGCNWCACSTAGLIGCTARACDAGVTVDAGR